jgi:flagellin
MRGQIRGLQQASRNAQDGISLIQTAEGAMNETHAILQRMRELSVQGANETNVTADRAAVSEELQALHKEITRIGEDTEFNTQKLIGSVATLVTIHIGANKGQNTSVSFADMRASGTKLSLGVNSTMKISGGASLADALIEKVNNALTSVSTERAKLGAIQNRLEHTIKNLDTGAENLQASESRIRDVDMAKEMMSYTKNNILNQAAQSMLAQANQAPQGVLQLLR